MLSRRNFLLKQLLADKQLTRLPSEYVEVEYLESTGTQCINTGYYPADLTNYQCELDIQFLDIKNCLNGVSNYNTNAGFVIGINGDEEKFTIGFTAQLPGVGSIDKEADYNRHNYKIRRNYSVKIDNTAQIVAESSTIFDNEAKEFYLFAQNGGDYGPQYFCRQRLYAAKFFDNNLLVHNFVPCYRKADGKPGLFDTVSHQFYINLSPGADFIRGLAIFRLNGSGRLTTPVIQKAVATLPEENKELIEKIIIGSGFVDNRWNPHENNCLDNFRSVYGFPNAAVLELPSGIGSVWNYNAGPMQKIDFNYVKLNAPSQTYVLYAWYDNSFANPCTWELPNYTMLGRYIFRAFSWQYTNGDLYVPNLTTTVQYGQYSKTPFKRIFFGNKKVDHQGAVWFDSPNLYFTSALDIAEYRNSGKWTEGTLVGVLDGNCVYTGKGFKYPRLKGTISIDPINGHLIKDGEDLFIGWKTVTWYKDEELATVIQPSEITSNMTVYVKLIEKEPEPDSETTTA